ncbi:MAG: hypothetical protein MUF64_22190 [Polyangiaceae bacterium]|nr:hypothetical protein [Polyangiaceae bacterium]
MASFIPGEEQEVSFEPPPDADFSGEDRARARVDTLQTAALALAIELEHLGILGAAFPLPGEGVDEQQFVDPEGGVFLGCIFVVLPPVGRGHEFQGEERDGDVRLVGRPAFKGEILGPTRQQVNIGSNADAQVVCAQQHVLLGTDEPVTTLFLGEAFEGEQEVAQQERQDQGDAHFFVFLGQVPAAEVVGPGDLDGRGGLWGRGSWRERDRDRGHGKAR